MSRTIILLLIVPVAAHLGGGRDTSDARFGRAAPQDSVGRWWKGNTHTHSLWSDGDGYPEMIADWYKSNGYHFLVMTDHNPPPAEKWVPVSRAEPLASASQAYRQRFGVDWARERRRSDTLELRLRRLDEYRALLEEANRFLLIPGEEITQYLEKKAAHMNGVNLAEPIPPQEGATLVEILRRDIEALRAQRRRTAQPMIGVLNHPNWLWSQTAEDLIVLGELRFFELYNGHPSVNLSGDSLHPGVERMWDIALTGRLARGLPLLYAVAADDAHDYHRFAPSERNPGRGWVMVRASELTPGAIVGAMERGDFYASTGVELLDVARDGRRISLRLRADSGASYTTQFIGTRRGYDAASAAVHDSSGTAITRRYSRDVGAVLAEVRGTAPSYTMHGDELYVRARVVSSRPKENPAYAGEQEMAWTQPVRP